MAKHKATLARVKGFKTHGVHFRAVSAKAARGACPFCGSASRDPFDVFDAGKLQWICHTCGEKGNFPKFLTMRMVEYQKAFDGVMAEILAEDRKLREATLHALGMGWDDAMKLYTIPLFHGNSVVNIMRYSMQTRHDFGTTGGKRGYMTLGGVADATTVHVVEGPWDVSAMWDGLGEGGVIGVAGALSGQGPGLVELCQGKNVVLGYDNDNAGLQADAKSREMLRGHIKTVQSIHWPTDAKNHYDVRDLWIECKRRPKLFAGKLKQYTSGKSRAAPKSRVVSDGPVGGTPPDAAVASQADLSGKGMPRNKVIEGFQKWLSLPDPEVLDIAFGMIFGNRIEGPPVWLYIVGPSGCGKSEIIMSLIGSPMIFSISTLTPPALMSGKNGPGGEDPSIIPKIDKHVLSIKDFTPILSMSENDQNLIFSILRDAYDGVIEKRYGGNVMFRHYESSFGILSGVTSEIERLGSSHTLVGQRFLKYYMREPLKINAGEGAIDSALDTLDSAKHSAMQAALKVISMAALDRPVLPEDRPKLSRMIKDRLKSLAMWTANLRGAVPLNKYTGEIEYMPTAEIGTRLAVQLGKLAMGIAVFRRKKSVSIDEFNIVAKVARDSVPNIVEKIIAQMYIHHRGEWTEAKELLDWLKLNDVTVVNTLERLVTLHVLEKESGEQRRVVYRISSQIKEQMGSLNLYGKEMRWKRAMREGD